jgi:nucleotide-binding universal stress UspA family protein
MLRSGVMKKILIAVNETTDPKAVLLSFHRLVRLPEEVVLLHVEKVGGRSRMYDMLGDAEMKTFVEALNGTEYKEKMDNKAERLLAHYRKALDMGGQIRVKTLVREGQPAEEILKAATRESVDMIILGFQKKCGLDRLIAASVGTEVEEHAGVPVLVAKRPLMCEEPYSWRDAYAAVSIFAAVFLGLFLFGFVLEKLSLLQ